MSSLIIILAVTLKLVEFPQASMQIPIGQNRKRGRPNKTKKALVRQNENNSQILMLKLQPLKNHQFHRPLLNLTNRMI